jgi:uncharacterized protein (TIGR01777 family)
MRWDCRILACVRKSNEPESNNAANNRQTRFPMTNQSRSILITGGSGLVGRHLSRLLQEKGYEVRHLGRRPTGREAYPTYRWDIARGEVDAAALHGLYGIVHLAGAGIADGRWTPERRAEILSSRVDGLRLLHRAMPPDQRPKVIVSASAIGFYGHRGDETLREDAAPQPGDFLSDTCVRWESALEPFAAEGLRSVRLRIGIVLSSRGGALAKMLPSYPFGVGAYFGNGRQWYSWIHLDDICRMFVFALENPAVSGAYNAVSPHPLRNRDFARAVGVGVGKKALLVPVPVCALRLAMGQMADVVLHSTRADAAKILSTGFRFGFEDAAKAVADLVKRKW